MTEKYWILNLGSDVQDYQFYLTVKVNSRKLPIWHEDKILFLVKDEELVSICRVARLRKGLESTDVLLDRRVEVPDEWRNAWAQAQLDLCQTKTLYQVADDQLAEKFVSTRLSANLEREEPFAGCAKKQVQRYIRELAVKAFEDDVLGPADGPYESFKDVSVRDRYLVGRLPPRNTFLSTEEDRDMDEENTNSDGNNFLAFVSDNRKEQDSSEVKQSTKLMLQPSSIGLSFVVSVHTREVMVEAGWGRYTKTTEPSQIPVSDEDDLGNKTSQTRDVEVWTRTPHRVTKTVSLDQAKSIVELEANQGVTVELVVRTSGDRKIVSVFLTNRIEHAGSEAASDDKWIFQPYLKIFDKEYRPIFLSREIVYGDKNRDKELVRLDMLYRDECEFAIGHGVSVHFVVAENKRRAVSVETRVIPKYEVPFTETPGWNKADRPKLQEIVQQNLLDMDKLADLATPESKDKLVAILSELADDYSDWISSQAQLAQQEPEIAEPAQLVNGQCRIALRRLREGIETLKTNDNALKAFAFANRAMALQRIRSMLVSENQKNQAKSKAGVIDHSRDNTFLEEKNKPQNHSWRAFQLAFFLLILPSLADPSHSHRQEDDAVGDLLWFPTGGGKTEAYLGAAAFAMAIRRLQKPMAPEYLDPSRGLAVIMRYTLRLLTLQQFQRASTLVCAMEVLRQYDEETWGKTPFSIGLWVGSQSTPNSIKEAAEQIASTRRPNGRHNADEAPFQITRCPWCGEPLRLGSNVMADEDSLQLHIHCGNNACDFSEVNESNLPLKVIDEEIYRHPPSMLIATVDKFAQMALKGETRTLFGLADKECPRHGLVVPDCDCHKNHKATANLPEVQIQSISGVRPPDLIIQDEFHLISGPLGTMVGLYETAVDALCSWHLQKDGKILNVHPKIVASSATVRKASEQMKGVFYRKMDIFPPNGLDAKDNFFSVQRPVKTHPGRLYLGLCAPGSAKPPVMIRMYVTLLTVAMDLYQRFEDKADPYMTAVGYFNSLRELGGMKRLSEDDVRTRCNRIEGPRQLTYRAGMCNRPLRFISELTSRIRNTEIPERLDQMSRAFTMHQGTESAPDIVLATNMLSVGVDVDRLGLMAVNGQPKNTAEYIQATSRVGRQFPGLVCTAYAWSRPRDLSHYESFEHYHATFYKHVEAQSVTPFSSRALDKGLKGALVSYVRLKFKDYAAETGAATLKVLDPKVNLREVVDLFALRAWKVTQKQETGVDVESRVEDALNEWERYANNPETHLVYLKVRAAENSEKLLKTDMLTNTKGHWQVPTSMREVEPSVCLILDNDAIKQPVTFRWTKNKTGEDSDNQN